ncbi:MAG: 4Fe-4S binding protein [Phycisphaerales bacterium]|nr:MAG: 4Fe-4S binding protein [Phycisphaerales bacterium]
MAVRNIVKIDEEKCTGCGLCVTACAEGAIKIINGKAKLVSDSYCDGLGACLGHCPEDAITVEPREAEPFDEEATKAYLASQNKEAAPAVCPGLAAHLFDDVKDADATPDAGAERPATPSQLGHWPVQLKLVARTAPYFDDADLLLVADCVPVAMADFHQRFLKGRAVAMGCPKLDDVQFYVAKLSDILRGNNIRSLTVLHMEVPCCSGLTRVAQEAIAASGKDMPFEDVMVGLRGQVLRSETITVEVEAEA